MSTFVGAMWMHVMLPVVFYSIIPTCPSRWSNPPPFICCRCLFQKTRVLLRGTLTISSILLTCRWACERDASKQIAQRTFEWFFCRKPKWREVRKVIIIYFPCLLCVFWWDDEKPMAIVFDDRFDKGKALEINAQFCSDLCFLFKINWSPPPSPFAVNHCPHCSQIMWIF